MLLRKDGKSYTTISNDKGNYGPFRGVRMNRKKQEKTNKN